MRNNEKTPGTQRDEVQRSAQFPVWDIIPPFQFINPRMKTVQQREEPNPITDPLFTSATYNPSTTSTTQSVTSDANSLALRKESQKDSDGGTSIEGEAGSHGEAGPTRTTSTTINQEPSDEASHMIINCPHCREELEIDEADMAAGEFPCPACGGNVEFLG